MIQKHYMDIDGIREGQGELMNGNTAGFEVGDIIQITEKFDASNACACYDIETDSMVAFSRKKELTGIGNAGLSGFFEYVQNLDKEAWKKYPNYRVFGEWSGAKNHICYPDEHRCKWYVFDIYDTATEKWLQQEYVRRFAYEMNLDYIREWYYGPFVSWEHVKSFCHADEGGYGVGSEGIVVKNQSKLNSTDTHFPFYIKIVNDKYKEKANIKVRTPQKASEEMLLAQEVAIALVTKNRVQKELFKMRDEGLLEFPLEPKDMGTIAKTLPRRMFNDCMKEDKEEITPVLKHFGKFCGTLTMKFAKEIVCK